MIFILRLWLRQPTAFAFAFALVSACAEPRRVSARLPSNFHLLRQIKVTKAKALNTHLCGASA
jgi:hypothetical protein